MFILYEVGLIISYVFLYTFKQYIAIPLLQRPTALAIRGIPLLRRGVDQPCDQRSTTLSIRGIALLPQEVYRPRHRRQVTLASRGRSTHDLKNVRFRLQRVFHLGIKSIALLSPKNYHSRSYRLSRL